MILLFTASTSPNDSNGVTATFDIKNSSFKGVKKHVEHDASLNHENKDIIPSRTKYNITEDLISNADFNSTMENRYHDKFIKYNRGRKKSGHTSAMYKNVDDYIKARFNRKTNHSLDKTAVVTFGNKQNQDSIFGYIDAVSHGKVKKNNIHMVLSNQSKNLANYARGFNNRNKYLKIKRFTTNLDESTPHVHIQLIPLGVTSSGNPSISINNAIKCEYHYETGRNISNSRNAMKWFREKEDNSLVDTFDRTYAHYHLIRTNKHIGDFGTYKKVKQEAEKKLVKDKVAYNTKITNYIKEKEPHHRILLKDANSNDDNTSDDYSDEVQTDKGYKQHVNNYTSRLLESALNVLRRSKQRFLDEIEKKRSEIKNAEKKLSDKFDFLKFNSRILDIRQKALSDKADKFSREQNRLNDNIANFTANHGKVPEFAEPYDFDKLGRYNPQHYPTNVPLNDYGSPTKAYEKEQDRLHTKKQDIKKGYEDVVKKINNDVGNAPMGKPKKTPKKKQKKHRFWSF